MKKCMAILNPSSGKEKALDYEQQIVQQLSEYEVEVRYTEGEGDATKFAREACEQQYEMVVLVGGDGTLNEGINGIAEQPYRPTVGIVPLGTVNDFARALGISLVPEEAIELLGGYTRKADIGKVNEHYFTNVIAIGDIAQAVGDVSVEQKSALGSFAYLYEGVKAAVTNESFLLKLEFNGQTIEQQTMMFLCVLTDSVGSFSKVNEEADVVDGLLHIFIIKSASILQVIGTAKNLLSGNYEADDNIIKLDAQQMTVYADAALKLNVDGDIVESVPAHISVLPKHIEFYASKTSE